MEPTEKESLGETPPQTEGAQLAAETVSYKINILATRRC